MTLQRKPASGVHVLRGALCLFLVSLGFTPAVHSQTRASPPQHASSAVTSAQVDDVLRQWNRPDSPGCALAVMQEGHTVYKHGYGMADLAHDAIITSNTPFHVASISKQFTAAAILLLEAQGKLSLDDDIRNYIPELHDFGTTITIRNLLHHTSGLREELDLAQLAGYRDSPDVLTDEDVMNLVARQKRLNFPPGSQYAYSNTGFTLAAQIVKRVSGQSLREFTTTNIFEPLGMAHTHFRDDQGEIIKGEALGYQQTKGGAFRVYVSNYETTGPLGLYTTVEDLAKWDEVFYGPTFGGPAFAQRMTHTDKLTTGKDNNYAMGLDVGMYRGQPIVEHSGHIAGYRATFVRFPEQHFSVACLCNTLTNPDAMSRKIADLFLADIFTEPPPLGLSDGELVHYPRENIAGKVGFYRAPNSGMLMMLSADDGVLQIMDYGEPKPLRTDHNGNFVLPEWPDVVRFDPAEGEAQRLIFQREGDPAEVWDRLQTVSPVAGVERQFVGRYYSEELDTTYEIQDREGKLLMKRKKHADDELVLVAGDLYADATVARWINWRVVVPVQFVRDAKGNVSGMTLATSRIREVAFVRQQPNE